MQTTTLPKANAHGIFEIRLESIGGLGANLTGKILGELGALYLGLNCSSFSSYGSEKKGSPVKSYIRYAPPETEIRVNSPVEKPHILGLFHEKLAEKAAVMAGVDADTAVIVNTDKDAEALRNSIRLHGGTLFAIDALAIAMANKTRVNMVMLGAVAKASGFIPLELVRQVVTDTLGRKYPAALPANLAGIAEGYEKATGVSFPNSEAFPFVPYKEPMQDWGYDNAPIGGVTPMYGSTVSNDLSAVREGYIPVFKEEACINCGLCDTTCPDMVFQFKKGVYKEKPAMVNLGPDYHHCKGCLRCVEVCPTDALTEGLEREHDLTKTHVRNQDLIVARMAFEEVGSNSYVESESGPVNETY